MWFSKRAVNWSRFRPPADSKGMMTKIFRCGFNRNVPLRLTGRARMLYRRSKQVNLRNMLAGIDANLDDLQSGVEACSRATHTIHTDAAAVDLQVSKLIEHVGLVGRLVRRARELEACVLDQSGALRELRQNFVLL